jgi:hypothetical protein
MATLLYVIYNKEAKQHMKKIDFANTKRYMDLNVDDRFTVSLILNHKVRRGGGNASMSDKLKLKN